MFNKKALLRNSLYSILITIFALNGCSKDKDPVGPGENPTDSFVTNNVKEEPTYFSVEKMKAVEVFDLAFLNETRDLSVYLNNNSHGSAGVTAKNLGVVDFNAEANVSDEFVADGDSSVVGVWYNYDIQTHTVSSKQEVYLVKASDYQVYKFKIESFADNTYKITLSPVDESGKPTNSKTLDIPASEGNPGYISLAKAQVVAPEPWDAGFVTVSLFVAELGAFVQNPALRINSADGAEIATLENVEYDEITSMPQSLTWTKDTDQTLAIGDRVLNYNPQNHRLTPPEVVYILKTTSGKFAKLKVTSYYNPDTGESGYFNFRLAVLN